MSRLSGGAWEWTGGDLEASGLVFGNNGQTRVADCLRDLAGSVCYEPPEEDGGGGGAELGLLGLLGLLGVLVVYLQVLRRRQQSIAHERFRLVRTEQVPVLPKLRGSGSAAMAAPGEVGVGGYHLFLSHIWASGQDQVGVIKARLSHFLVGARIFRDVDDMEDISLLEDYVDASSLVLVFLSEVHPPPPPSSTLPSGACTSPHAIPVAAHPRPSPCLPITTTQGYFLSRNCLREAHAAVRGGKPMVLVHETDVKHGGAPLETLYAECPDDLRDAIFGHRLDGGGECGTGGGSSLMRQDSMSSSEKASRYHRSERASADAGGGGCASSAGGGGAPLIRWHRLNDLQVTSLLQVASVLLRVVSNSPTADSALYLPSHVTRKSVDVAHAVRLSLHTPTHTPTPNHTRHSHADLSPHRKSLSTLQRPHPGAPLRERAQPRRRAGGGAPLQRRQRGASEEDQGQQQAARAAPSLCRHRVHVHVNVHERSRHVHGSAVTASIGRRGNVDEVGAAMVH